MNRYFFNYRDAGHYYPDGEGTDFPSLAAAEAFARESVSELLGSERAESDPSFFPGTYEITDDSGAMLAIVRFDGKLAA
jgi:hypothetical protein